MRRVVEVAYAATAIRLPDITMVQAICGYYDVVLVLVVVGCWCSDGGWETRPRVGKIVA